MKRAALIAGVSIATLVCAGPTPVQAWSRSADPEWRYSRAISPYDPAPRRSFRKRARSTEQKSERGERKSGRTPDKVAAPSGPLHIVVSIDKQRATLFDNGVPVASTAISSGTSSHPTPMGVFTIIQKNRHHVSNLYHAPMPYMQRITWSGSALHQGPLPGYPASHGCVRLTGNFAELLWKTTKLGARVIVTRDEVAPVTFEHARLFVPRPKVADAHASTSALVKTADAANAVAVVGDTKPAVAEPAARAPTTEPPTKLSSTDGAGGTTEPVESKSADVQPAEAQRAEAQTVEAKPVAAKPVDAKSAELRPVETSPRETIAAPAPIIVDERPKTMPAVIVKEANNRPISVFVSLKEAKLYVRQGWQPLFETPVTFEHPDQPIGTHVYTAMGTKADSSALRWTVVSIPSSTKRAAEAKASNNGRKSRNERTVKPAEIAAPLPGASAALDRIVMPPDAVERISELITPGSSLIVSDNKLSDETGAYTDFIVLTR